ncbi:MAG: class I SAM-dependent methyltransferase [Gammaproteobacteria bacterium]|nr:class I SAM-dependent methyltransferase [Gammaproteobacteria bacterium]
MLILPLHARGDGVDLDSASAVKLKQIMQGEHRTQKSRDRDVYRHPLETLMWFGLREEMTIVEIFPGGGWYTALLAPFVREKGHYYGAGFDRESSVDFFRKAVKRLDDKLAADPARYDKVIITELAPPHKTAIAPPASADMVLTFRNVHNWMAGGYEDGVFAAMYAALKPGGVLGLVEHRGDPSVPQDAKAKSGYVNEDAVIAMAQRAGFKLLGRSEINANAKDSKDYPKGVWTLPPTLGDATQSSDRYLAIGESDRMTLKFIKPRH